MSALDKLDWSEVRNHYDNRTKIHRQLLELYQDNSISRFVDLLLGISDPAGNYSADEHKLGPQIIANNRNADDQVAGLAEKFMYLTNARAVPELIRDAA